MEEEINLKALVEKLISKIKKKPYKIDDDIPIFVFLEILGRRIVSLMRFILVFKKNKISFLERRVLLQNKKNILIGNGVTIERDVTINALSRNPIVLSNNVTIGQNTIIQGSGVITELGEGLSIGENSGIGAFNFIGCQGGVRIEENVIIGPRVSLHSENHNFMKLDIPIKEQGVNRKGIVIEKDCWIGGGVIILDGVTIGSGSVVAAGAIVNKSIPPNSIAAGCPAKIVKVRG